ncbi:FAD binding domain-containing protein [Azospirillum sp. ST 5-10]|uniref:FAD binding domain-containing protein n=1 Tax=unclassified Azospirillum TaxID=2630922 RepID=UPI003F4A622F
MGAFHRPSTLDEALTLLRGRPLTLLAGGTDVYPARVAHPPDEDMLDLTGIRALSGIAEEAGGHRLGALATWSDLAEADLPPWFDGYRLAARQVGGVQVQNAGTLAGNLCNASPAADGTPNLLVLDAEVELASAAGVRRLPVADFVTGNRCTLRRPDEVVTALRVPAFAPGTAATFLKLGARRYLVISIVMVAALLEPAEDGTVGRLHVAVGACSAVPQRLSALERDLAGRPVDARLADRVRPEHLAALAPIDDVRASAEYRRDAALILVRRAIAQLVAQLVEDR